MLEEKLYQIEELSDLKVNWTESYKCLDEPLLEYVWEVANHFLPDYEETDKGMIPIESTAPAIFANRYAERNLSVEERYERNKEMNTFKGALEEYKNILKAQKEGVKFNEEQYQKSLPLIKTQLKALIARDLWDMNEYFRVMNTTNESIQKALEILNSDEYQKKLKQGIQ